jgi:anaerobic magnesium-protoporphyrin IX monomethyl ester cyclase
MKNGVEPALSIPERTPAGRTAKKDAVILFFPNPTPGDATQARVPYSLLYLERALRNLGVEVVLLDEQQQPDYSTILAAHSDSLLLAGVSSLTGEQIYGGIAFSKKVRESCDAPIVWGGWHPTLLPEQTLQEPYIDYVVVGQGERPLRQLVERLREGDHTSDIPGLGFKHNGTVTVNPPAPLEDINTFPRINLGALDLKKYLNRSRLPEHFLGYFAATGVRWTAASVASVKSTIAAGNTSPSLTSLRNFGS